MFLKPFNFYFEHFFLSLTISTIFFKKVLQTSKNTIGP